MNDRLTIFVHVHEEVGVSIIFLVSMTTLNNANSIKMALKSLVLQHIDNCFSVDNRIKGVLRMEEINV